MIEAERSEPNNPGAPLEGIRVLDLGTFIAGPFAATLLGEFGAEVIKVEMPVTGDPCRQFGSSSGEEGMTLPWLSESRNKKSITLNLKKKEGADLLRALVKKSDILCENFRAGTLEEWGLGYDDLLQINPRLIMVRISAYGQTGPYNDRPGFGRIANAFSGLSYLAGDPAGPPVTPGSATLADYNSGLFGALGALLALRSRDATGRGQYVDIGLYESIFRLLDELVPAYGMHGTVRERMGATTVNVAPHSHYPTRDGKWVAIACTTDKIFYRLAEVMGRHDLVDDPSYAKRIERVRNTKSIDEIVGTWTSGLTAADLIEKCSAGSVPCGLVNSVADLFADAQVRERGNIVPVEANGIGEIFVPNIVPRLSTTPGRIDWLGPRLGEHNREVYKSIVGLSDDELGDLEALGVI